MAIHAPSLIRVLAYSINSAIMGIILGFFAKLEWADFYKAAILPLTNVTTALVLLPIVLIFNIVLTTLAFIEIANKGIAVRTIGAFFVELFKMLQTLISILSMSAIIATSSLLVPILFTIAIGLEAIFNGYHFVLHLWNLNHSETPQEHYAYKLLSAKFGVNFFVSSILAIGIGLTLLSSIGATSLFIIGILTACIATIGGIASVVFSYYADQKIKPLEEGLGEEPKLRERLIIEEHNEQEERRPVQVSTILLPSDDEDLGGNGAQVETTQALSILHHTIFYHPNKPLDDTSSNETDNHHSRSFFTSH